jgi:hypothetical protein
MSAFTLSFLIYSGVIAVVGAMVHSKGRELAHIDPFEFLFLYLPWLALLSMAVFFFGSIEIFDQRSSIWMYFWILQTISAGMVGGFVLMPRYFVQADTIAAKVLTNTLSGLAISGVFAFSRVFLFALSGASASE